MFSIIECGAVLGVFKVISCMAHVSDVKQYFIRYLNIIFYYIEMWCDLGSSSKLMYGSCIRYKVTFYSICIWMCLVLVFKVILCIPQVLDVKWWSYSACFFPVSGCWLVVGHFFHLLAGPSLIRGMPRPKPSHNPLQQALVGWSRRMNWLLLHHQQSRHLQGELLLLLLQH